MLLHRGRAKPPTTAVCGSCTRLPAWAMAVRSPQRRRCNSSSARPVARDSGQPGNDQGTSKQEEKEEEEEAETFSRFVFEGILQSAILVGAANLAGQSDSWNWAIPADGIQTTLACALPSSLLVLAICLPVSPAATATNNTKLLEQLYDSSSGISLVVATGGDEERRQPSLKKRVGAETLASALSLLQAFLTRPWVPSQPLATAGFIVKQTLYAAAVECLLRGTVVAGLATSIKSYLQAQVDPGWLFWPKAFVLADEDNVMGMAVLLTVLLLTPATLFQTRQIQDFVRAAVNKPIQDKGVAAIVESTSLQEFAQRVEALSKIEGADAEALSVLLADVQLPKPSSKQQRKAGVGEVDGGAQGSASVASASGEGGAEPGLLRSPHISRPTLQQIQSAEKASSEAFAALKAARTPQEVEASSLALLDAASSTAEAALGTIVQMQGVEGGGRVSDKMAAALASAAAVKASQIRLQVATEAEAAEAQEMLRSDQFATLLVVETPEDKLAAQLTGAYFMSGMVAVNAAFLATGSLAVSFSTGWMIRILPFLITEVWRHVKENSTERYE